MIAQDQVRVFDAGLHSLSEFREQTKIAGRFVALYLGLRRMQDLAALGSARFTPASDIYGFLDDMLTKTNRRPPLVVLTAPFGGSHSANSGYSTRSGETTPGRREKTNTWRNNVGIQKGVGCLAAPEVIDDLLHDPLVRLACPHIRENSTGGHFCSIEATKRTTKYRGEEHSIWLRRTDDGYQVVDLNLPRVYEPYLCPAGRRIPLFALIAILYGFAPAGIYPLRQRVGIPDFAEDFKFTLSQVRTIFDVDPESDGNAPVLRAAEAALNDTPSQTPVAKGALAPQPKANVGKGSSQLPPESLPIELNTGVGAERLVAKELDRHNWLVAYLGNQRRIGYDLQAERGGQTLYVEVKSSVGFTSPELSESEWLAAQHYGESYILAVVDFYGSGQQCVWYIRDPANNALATGRSVTVFRLQRASIEPLATEAEFL
jgi:hypothetical protein